VFETVVSPVVGVRYARTFGVTIVEIKQKMKLVVVPSGKGTE